NRTALANKLSEGGMNVPVLGGIHQLLLQISGRPVRVFFQRCKFRSPQNDADGLGVCDWARAVISSEGYCLNKFPADWRAPDGRRAAPPSFGGGHDTPRSDVTLLLRSSTIAATCSAQRLSAVAFSA